MPGLWGVEDVRRGALSALSGGGCGVASHAAFADGDVPVWRTEGPESSDVPDLPIRENRVTGYVYVKNWERFQHYGNRKPVWIKTYLDLLENEDYLNLSAADRALLEGLWKLVGVCGNGRVQANPSHLRARLRLRKCNLEPLIKAGWIEVRASKSLAGCYQVASAELEEEKEPPFKGSPKDPKRHRMVARVCQEYNKRLEDGELPAAVTDQLFYEYRHDKSIVTEAIPEAKESA